MNNQNLLYLSLISGIIALLGLIYALWKIRALSMLKNTFFAGHTGQDLEDVILQLSQKFSANKEELLILNNHLSQLKNEFQHAVQKIGVVRFNPFADGGGNFSFTMALLDGLNNGVIITSMHGREQNRIYSKQIINGKSDSQLTEEEEKAIFIANDKFKKQIPNQTANTKIRQHLYN